MNTGKNAGQSTPSASIMAEKLQAAAGKVASGKVGKSELIKKYDFKYLSRDE